MRNSTVLQLIRDAKKKGAYQAKLAYVEYMQNESKPDVEIQAVLKEIDDKAPKEYQAHADYLRGLQLERIKAEPAEILKQYQKVAKETKHYTLACSRLVNIYNALSELHKKNGNTLRHEFYKRELAKLQKAQPKLSTELTEDETAEFKYKMLRLEFNEQILARSTYIEALEKLLSHRELTDTLEAKIRFQLIQQKLLQVCESGSHRINPLKDAMLHCEAFDKPRLAPLAKADKVRTIKFKLDTFAKSILESKDSIETKSDLIARHVRSMLDTPHIQAAFKKEKVSAEITDGASNHSMRIVERNFEITRLIGGLAYARAITSGTMFEIQVKHSTLTKITTAIAVSGESTIADVKRAFVEKQEKAPAKCSFFFDNTHYTTDTQTMKDIGIKQGDVVVCSLS